jgi:F-type H+-transporting ATPase subunit b
VLIDWVTVGAQIVNFLILVWLLKHFLYDRILRAVDQREQRIASQFEEAREREAEAQEQRQELERQRRELEEARQEKLDQAEEEARAKRKELEDRAREEATRLEQSWRRELASRQAGFLRQLREMAGREVYQVARRALADLADADVQRQALATFRRRLAELDQDQRREMAQALDQAEEVAVKSARELDDDQRRELGRALREELEVEPALSFATAPELGLGLELRTPGRKVAWSAAAYLDDLEDRARRLLARQAGQSGSGAGARSEGGAEDGTEGGEPGGDQAEEQSHGG